jgi:hypothetical protein
MDDPFNYAVVLSVSFFPSNIMTRYVEIRHFERAFLGITEVLQPKPIIRAQL